MELLAEIADHGLPAGMSSVRIRKAARAVLHDNNGQIPLLFVSKHGYHKLPGGGIERKESNLEALKRECLEETGCTISIQAEVGRVTEYRHRWLLMQTSYCYYGCILSKGRTSFTEKETDQGFRLLWLSLDDAIRAIKSDRPDCYEGSFIRKRDLAFLKRARQIHSKEFS